MVITDLLKELGISIPPAGYVMNVKRKFVSVEPRRRTFIGKIVLKDPRKFEVSDPGRLITHVKLQHINIIGAMGSGKTTLSLTFAYAIEKYYSKKFRYENGNVGPFNVVTIVAPSLVSALSYVPEGSEVITLVVDDAPIYHFAAGRRKEDVYQVGTFFLIRHLILRKSKAAKYVILLFNTQRFKSLDITLRSAPINIFKTLLGTAEELMEMRKELGADLLRALIDITRGIYRDDNEWYYRFYVYKAVWNEKGIVELEKTAVPSNIIIAGKERKEMLLKLIDKTFSEINVSKALQIIIANLCKNGITWGKILRTLLPTLRAYGLKISHEKAYKVCKESSSSSHP